MTDDNSVDKTFENESTRDLLHHMVRISIKEYDALRDKLERQVNILQKTHSCFNYR